MVGASKPAMPDIDTADLRDCAKNIHSIGPDRAAGLLTAAAEVIDKLRGELGHLRRAVELDDRVEPVMSHTMRAKAESWYRDVFARRWQQPTIAVVGEERGCPPGACLADPRCCNRAEMRAAHGTPEEFERSIMQAAAEFSVAEADRAVANYRAAWADATEPSAEVQRALNSELSAMGCDPASATQAEFKRAMFSVQHLILVLSGNPATLTMLSRTGRSGTLVKSVAGPYEAICVACEGEQFEGAICNTCGDHVELVANGDGTFRRIYHSPDEIEAIHAGDDDAADLATHIIGAPSLAIAERFDAEAQARAEDPGEIGDGLQDEAQREHIQAPHPKAGEFADLTQRLRDSGANAGPVRYYDTTLGKVMMWDGNTWVDAEPVARVDLWPGSGLPPLMSTTTRGELNRLKDK